VRRLRRLVVQSAAGGIVSWALGDCSPTRVVSAWDHDKFGRAPAWLLAASYQSGTVVGYHDIKGKTLYDATA
jgi:hypothetical protein